MNRLQKLKSAIKEGGGEMFFELFVFGSVLWWLLIILGSILLIWALEEESFGWATATIITAVVLMQFGGDLNLHKGLGETNWWLVGGTILGYLGVGVFWGCVKWYFYVGKKREEYDEIKRKWLEKRGVRDTLDVPANLKADFRSYLISDHWGTYTTTIYEYDKETKKSKDVQVPSVRPFAKDNKARIIAWMAYWPWSMLWALIDDVWHKLFKWAQEATAALMDAIAARRFDGVESDFTVEDEITDTPEE